MVYPNAEGATINNNGLNFIHIRFDSIERMIKINYRYNQSIKIKDKEKKPIVFRFIRRQ